VKHFDKIFLLHSTLQQRRTPIGGKELEAKLECSPATRERVIRELRDVFGAPIEYNRELNGYFYGKNADKQIYELPGLWFTAQELQALLACQHILVL